MLGQSFRAVLSFRPKAVLTAIVGSVTVLGFCAWGAMSALDYADTLSRAQRDTGQAAALLEGHAVAVLEGGASTLARVAGRMEDSDLSHLAESALREAMAVTGWGEMSIVDIDGKTVFGPTIDLMAVGEQGDAAALDHVLHGVPADDEPATTLLPGHADGVESIVLARRLVDGRGRSSGAVLLALPTSTLSAVLKVFGDGQHRFAGLFRPDGMRLAGFGTADLGALPRIAPGQSAVADDWMVGGQRSVIGLQRMKSLPVIAAVALPRAAVLAPWHERLYRGLAVCGIGTLALVGLARLGWAAQRREEAARDALRDANARLEQRVEERTTDLRALNLRLVRALTDKERANQAKARFLSAANHDLRQPFQALRLFHHLLLDRLKDPRDHAVAEKMGEALESGEKLLNALLEVATLDAGAVRATIADVPVSTVLDAVAGEFRKAAADKGLDLRIRPTAAVVRTDKTLLTRMLRDLLRNAISYTPTGGVLVGCRQRGTWLAIEIWDTGTGIPVEQQEAIFEDFVQLGNPERDRRRGLGLGLAKVRRKAALLGHTVTVRSRFGRGSVFTLLVPLASAAESAKTEPAVAPTVAVPAEPGAERLILVVEDDAVQRGGMQLLLESWGHRVIAAENGTAALEELRAASRLPDVIVTDFRLPGLMTGAQFVRRAAELAGRPIPGIILTGDTAPERIREALDAGCRLLHKPFNPDRLREALNTVGAERARAEAQSAVWRTAARSAV